MAAPANEPPELDFDDPGALNDALAEITAEVNRVKTAARIVGVRVARLRAAAEKSQSKEDTDDSSNHRTS